MIEPIMTYCCILYLGLSTTRIDKLDVVIRKAVLVIDGKNIPLSDAIGVTFQKNVPIEVFKCLNKLGPDYFGNYFCKISHNYDTRGNNFLLKIPNMKTESGRSFRFQGTLVFSKLPKEIRDENSFISFKRKILNRIFSLFGLSYFILISINFHFNLCLRILYLRHLEG